MKLNTNERYVLLVLSRYERDDFGYLNFSQIERKTGLDRKTIRRAVRSLARKGLTEFARGLCNEDGAFAGSGYACTHRGHMVITEEVGP